MNCECPVCYIITRQDLYYDCIHSMCFNCFIQWNSINKTCPLCRSKILKDDNNHLDNNNDNDDNTYIENNYLYDNIFMEDENINYIELKIIFKQNFKNILMHIYSLVLNLQHINNILLTLNNICNCVLNYCNNENNNEILIYIFRYCLIDTQLLEIILHNRENIEVIIINLINSTINNILDNILLNYNNFDFYRNINNIDMDNLYLDIERIVLQNS